MAKPQEPKESAKWSQVFDQTTQKVLQETLVDPAVDNILTQQPPSTLESSAQQHARLQASMRRAFLEYQGCFVNARQLLIAAHFNPEKIDEHFLEQWSSHFEDNVLRLQDGDVTIQELVRLSNRELSQIYEIARSHYKKQEYTNARDLFILLSTLNPRIPEFWVALAMTEQQLHHFDVAATGYAIAAELDPENPSLYLHAAHALHLQHRNVEAIQVLQALLTAIDSDPTKWVQVREQAQSMITEFQAQAKA